MRVLDKLSDAAWYVSLLFVLVFIAPTLIIVDGTARASRFVMYGGARSWGKSARARRAAHNVGVCPKARLGHTCHGNTATNECNWPQEAA